MASSLKIQPLSSKNRPGVVQVVFDQHMRTVPALYNFLKLRPITLILWTAISTSILKVRRTNLYDYAELMMTLAVSVLLAHGGLFLALLYDASSSSPGPEVVGRLDEFVDQDASSSSTSVTSSKDAQVDAESVNVSSVKKRSAVASSKPTSTTESNTTTSTIVSSKKEDNLFWVLEKNQEVIGSIGALVNKAKGEAQLVSWAVSTKNQRNGAGTLLLKRAMEQLCTQKKGSITVIRAVVQGHQVPALRIFHSLGFKQVERTPEWMNERVVLEFQCKDWGKK